MSLGSVVYDVRWRYSFNGGSERSVKPSFVLLVLQFSWETFVFQVEKFLKGVWVDFWGLKDHKSDSNIPSRHVALFKRPQFSQFPPKWKISNICKTLNKYAHIRASNISNNLPLRNCMWSRGVFLPQIENIDMKKIEIYFYK